MLLHKYLLTHSWVIRPDFLGRIVMRSLVGTLVVVTAGCAGSQPTPAIPTAGPPSMAIADTLGVVASTEKRTMIAGLLLRGDPGPNARFGQLTISLVVEPVPDHCAREFRTNEGLSTDEIVVTVLDPLHPDAIKPASHSSGNSATPLFWTINGAQGLGLIAAAPRFRWEFAAASEATSGGMNAYIDPEPFEGWVSLAMSEPFQSDWCGLAVNGEVMLSNPEAAVPVRIQLPTISLDSN